MFARSQIKGPVALVGANGMLAQMVRQRAPRGVDIKCFDLPEFDMTDRATVLSALSALQPRIIINCAAFTAVDACEEQEPLATRVNADGVANLVAAAIELDATLVHVSTDYVFAGDQAQPYREEDPPGPLSAYGRSKLKGEQAIIASGLEKYLLIRTSWLYGPGGGNFVETILRLAAEREELRIIADQVGSPTYTADLADAIYNLLAVAASPRHNAPSIYGIYHFANEGHCSWYEFTREIVALARKSEAPLKVKRIIPIATEDYPLPAVRPAYSVFAKQKYMDVTGCHIPVWQTSLENYLNLRNA